MKNDELAEFRSDCRRWIDENAPDSIKGVMMAMDDCPWGGRNPVYAHEGQRLWFERMRDKRWICPEWPVEYGGAGLESGQARILQEELARANCRPPLSSLGIKMLAPVLFRYGSEAQKKQFLQPIAAGEIRWCQGYSEPGAGSDLAGVQTRAVRDGDYYVVNGSKVWTSHANLSDWIFCLVRTNPDAPKHQGISFLLIDMASAGVETRPIRLISGKSPFCETFFDDVKVPATQLIGEEGQGWEVAKYLLSFERSMIAGAQGNRNRDPGLLAKVLALGSGKNMDALANRAAEVEIEAMAANALVELGGQALAQGLQPPAYASLLKLAVSEQNQRRLDMAMDIRAAYDDRHASVEAVADDLTTDWLRSRANSIEGGSSEIQLNIIARQLLELR